MPSASPIPNGTRTALVWCREYETLLETLSRECPQLHTLFVIGNRDNVSASALPFELIPVAPNKCETLPDIYARHPRLFCEGRVNCFIEDAIRKQHPRLCAEVEKGLLEFTRETLAQTAFRATKGWHLLAGTLLNLPRIFKSPSLDNIKNINRNRPAVIVGAGPALDSDVPILATVKEQTFIIACDAAWNTLINHDIKPDLVISTDSRDCTWQHLEQGSREQPDVPVVTLLSGSWSVVRYYPGPLFFARQPWPLDQHIEQACKRSFPVLDTGKCVGNAAFELAKYIGSERIVFIGFNLGFEGNRYHPEQRAVSEFHDTPHADANLLKIPGNDEKTIKTDYSMFYYLRYFEKQIAACDIPVFNATTGGAYIHGCRRTNLPAALENINHENGIKGEIPTPDPVPDLQPDEFLQNLQQWCFDYLKEVQQVLSSPGKQIAHSGKTPLPLLDRCKDLSSILLSADNPALSAALQLSWENWRRHPSKERENALLGNINDYLLHSAMIIQLIDALLRLSPQKARKPGLWVTFLHDEDRHNPLWKSTLRDISSQPNNTLIPCREPIDDIPAVWKAIDEAEGIIMYNSYLMPFLWAFPGAKCIDVIDQPPSQNTLIEQWLPGYSIVTRKEYYDAWKMRVPSNISVSICSTGNN